jgi:putative drug exporter of the RND superfamily
MRGLAHWCVAHRRRVVVVWIVVAVLTTVVAHAVGPSYVTSFGLPGTDSQRALDLLKGNFKTQSGDVDTVVLHVSRGTVDSPAVWGAVQVSPNRMTAFATVNYDQPAMCLRMPRVSRCWRR